MTGSILTRMRLDTRPWAKRVKPLLAVSLAGMLGGCVQVSAPDKPIEINLNINIRQEVVVSLRDDARELIEDNPGVF